MNLTDIDDRIISRAAAEGITTRELTDRHAARFLADIEAVGMIDRTSCRGPRPPSRRSPTWWRR